jgi:hypothetical protein
VVVEKQHKVISAGSEIRTHKVHLEVLIFIIYYFSILIAYTILRTIIKITYTSNFFSNVNPQY